MQNKCRRCRGYTQYSSWGRYHSGKGDRVAFATSIWSGGLSFSYRLGRSLGGYRPLPGVQARYSRQSWSVQRKPSPTPGLRIQFPYQSRRRPQQLTLRRRQRLVPPGLAHRLPGRPADSADRRQQVRRRLRARHRGQCGKIPHRANYIPGCGTRRQVPGPMVTVRSGRYPPARPRWCCRPRCSLSAPRARSGRRAAPRRQPRARAAPWPW